MSYQQLVIEEWPLSVKENTVIVSIWHLGLKDYITVMMTTDNRGGRSLPVTAPKLWNAFPKNINAAKTVDSCKKWPAENFPFQAKMFKFIGCKTLYSDFCCYFYLDVLLL